MLIFCVYRVLEIVNIIHMFTVFAAPIPPPCVTSGLLKLGDDCITMPTGRKFDQLADLFNKGGVALIFAFAGFGLLVMIVAAGIALLTSGGDAKKIEAAKGQLTNALIGFFVVFGSYWIVKIVASVFGLGTITKTLFP